MLSIVTHHLTAEGRARFPDWFNRMRAQAAAQPGFVSVRMWLDPESPDARLVVLEMESEAATARWIACAAKQQLLAELPALSRRPFEARRLMRVPDTQT